MRQAKDDHQRKTFGLIAVLSVWLTVTVGMAYVATSSFSVTDSAQLRQADQVFADIEDGAERKMALRYIASELNRTHFPRYDTAGLCMGALSVLLFFLSGRRGIWVPGALIVCLAATLVSAFHLTPALITQGRAIDFLPRDPTPPEVDVFHVLHGLSMAFELGKTILLASVLFSLFRSSPVATANPEPEHDIPS